MKIKLTKVGLYGYKKGDVVNIGKPNQKWRRAIKDSKIDGNIEIIEENKAKSKNKTKGEKE